MNTINGKFNSKAVLMEINQKYRCSNFFLCQKLKSRVSIQLKPIWILSCVVLVSPAALNTA
jgi:hypothetical protein